MAILDAVSKPGLIIVEPCDGAKQRLQALEEGPHLRLAACPGTSSPIDLNSAALGIGRHVSRIADPFNGHIDQFLIAHVERSDS